jgi:hypothetical protein
MQLSTAISDGVLAAATILAAVLLARAGLRWCAAWMTAIALAAIVGALRFSGAADVTPLHAALSSFAAVVAFPSFCWAMMRSLQLGRDLGAGESLLIAAVLNLLLLVAAPAEVATAVGALALAVALVGARRLYVQQRRGAALTVGWAVALYAIAGLWVGTFGTIGPLLRVDAYHYLLAVANLLFAFALAPLRRGAKR